MWDLVWCLVWLALWIWTIYRHVVPHWDCRGPRMGAWDLGSRWPLWWLQMLMLFFFSQVIYYTYIFSGVCGLNSLSVLKLSSSFSRWFWEFFLYNGWIYSFTKLCVGSCLLHNLCLYSPSTIFWRVILGFGKLHFCLFILWMRWLLSSHDFF